MGAADDLGIYRAYGALLLMALLPIVAGSFASLRMPKEAKKRWRLYHAGQKSRGKRGDRRKEHEGEDAEDDSEDEDEDEDEEIDRLTAEDAYIFPIMGSVVLFGLYLAFKYLPKELINKVIGGYLAVMGIGATARMATKVVEVSVADRTWRGFPIWSLSLKRDKKEYVSAKANWVHISSAALALALAAVHQIRPHWIISNVLALAFAFNAISLLRLDSFFTGSALLALLFFYDIWWVFGSKRAFGADVMVSVATNLEAPIKVQFPKDLVLGKGMSLLGLGDIVLPGIFVALALRYDYHRAIKHEPPPKPSEAFPRPYFHTVFLAYVVGLVTTVYVMHTFRAAQPALLYLSPACIGSVVLCALARGELKALWAFDDGSDDEKPKKKDGDDEQTKKKDGDDEQTKEKDGDDEQSKDMDSHDESKNRDDPNGDTAESEAPISELLDDESPSQHTRVETRAEERERIKRTPREQSTDRDRAIVNKMRLKRAR